MYSKRMIALSEERDLAGIRDLGHHSRSDASRPPAMCEYPDPLHSAPPAMPRDCEYDHTVHRRSDGTRQTLRPVQPWPAEKPFKILSIDGGGILGILPCMVLAEVEKRFLGGEPIGQHSDMIVGTSTGGIIVLGLGQGKSAQEISKLYIERGRFIFPGNRITRWLRGFAGWVFTPYSRASLENELRREFGDGLFGSSSIPTCIPSFDGRYGSIKSFLKLKI